METTRCVLTELAALLKKYDLTISFACNNCWSSSIYLSEKMIIKQGRSILTEIDESYIDGDVINEILK
jgi:hypothetical protein